MTATPTRDQVPSTFAAQRAALIAFLKRPRLPDGPTGVSRASLVATLRLFAIDAALMLAIGLVAALAVAGGLELPENLLDEIPLTPMWIAVIVLGAPLTEELAFRLGLSGRPGHLVAIPLLVPAFLAISEWGWLAGGVPALLVLLLLFWWARRQAPLRWFVRSFPVIFWLVAALFAAVHLVNYEEVGLLIMLPLVLPQFVAGVLFGYARVHYGLWSAMLLHALHNGAAVCAILLGEALGATA